MTKIVKLLLWMIATPVFAQVDFQENVNQGFAAINSAYAPILFWPIPIIQLPLILFVMVAGGIFFTFRFNFVNVRLFKHAIDVLKCGLYVVTGMFDKNMNNHAIAWVTRVSLDPPYCFNCGKQVRN